MSSSKRKRNRGVILTKKGLEKLKTARYTWEQEENYGERTTYETISEITNLDINTVKKILGGREKADKRSLEKFCIGFGLKLEAEFYTKFNPKIREDWGEAVSIDHFFGRVTELDTLTSWLVSDRCRLITLQGMGGIGKTTLSIQFANQIKGQFDCVIWKSLRDSPPIAKVLAELIEFLSEQKETEQTLPQRIKDRITILIDLLRSQRCLVILDNAESLLDGAERAGKYREGYEAYSQLLSRVGATHHQSCLILTTREKPKEIAALEGDKLPVRCLKLDGLKDGVGNILQLKGLEATEAKLDALGDRFCGNPLALKVVATTIKDLFAGDVALFLQQEKAVFGDVRDILEQQFERLSELERKLMYWLAIAREPVSVAELREDVIPPFPAIEILEALESLSRRSLIERNTNAGFTQQPVVMEYVTSRLIEISSKEISDRQLDLLHKHALIKATAKDYIRENQNRLILQPLINRLLIDFNSKQDIEIHLNQILLDLQKTSPTLKGYAAGNMLNLLVQMETDLTGYDFSNLCVWQADLRQAQLHDVNFQNSDLSKSAFAENFGGIWSVAFSPDGEYLAAGDTKGDIILRRVADGQPIMRFRGHTAWVVSLDFSPDGKTLASSSCDCTTKLWDITNGKCLHSLDKHEHEVWSVAFSSDGKILASGCDDHKARLWDVKTGKRIKVFQEHEGEITSVAFNLEGELLTGSHDNTIKLWNIKTGECKRTFKGHEDGVRSISISSDGKTLASGSSDRTIRLWHIETGKCLKVLEGHSNIIMSVAFSAKGNFLASSSMGQKVRLWETNTGECLKVFHGHSNIVNSVVFSFKNDILASGSYDQSVKLWNVDSHECLKTFQGYSNQALSLVFGSDENSLISSGHDQRIRLWDIQTGKVVKTLSGHSNWVFSIAFSSQHNIIASGSGDKTIKLWNASTGKLVKTFHGHEAAVKSVAFSADEQILTSGSDDRTIKLWDLQSGRCLKTLQEHQAEIWSIACSNDGKTLASASFDDAVKLWDVKTGKCLQTLNDHESWVVSVAFSPDNRTLASTSSDQTIKIWNVETAKCITTLNESVGYSQLVAFSIDGQIIASFNAEHHIKLWEVSTGKCWKILQGHTALINSLVFSPDGLTLVSSSEDETIKIWDLETGRCLKSLRAKNPYENMNIDRVSGLTESTIETLKVLGVSSNELQIDRFEVD